eukprot:gene14335-61_t
MSRDRLPPDAAEITNHISELLQRDPAVFLERYGSRLQPQEISAFEPLRESNYEIDYWLRHVQQQHEQVEVSSSGQGNSQQLSTTVKNRRLAYMQRLQKQGDYFSEDSMRGREPLIWHEYVGQHEGHALPSAAAPTGEGLAGSLLRAHDEALLRARLEQQLEEEQCQMSEHESDSEDGLTDYEGPAANGTAGLGASGKACAGHTAADSTAMQGRQQQQDPGAVAAVDMSDLACRRRRQELTEEMQSRFLLGLDDVHQDYGQIDADASLDDDWAEQAARDAEDAYFDAD